MEKIQVGPFVVQIDREEVVVIPAGVVQKLEECLTRVRTSSLIVRLDMAPWDGEGTPPLFEVETAPGGLMFWGLFPPFFPQEIVSSLADMTVCLHRDWEEPYKLLSSFTGWEIYTSWEEVPPGRIYFSGVPEEIPERVLRRIRTEEYDLITDPFCPKTKTLEITGGMRLVPGLALKDLDERFPDGFVIKPVWGWGSRDIYLYPRRRYGWMRRYAGSCGKKRIREFFLSPPEGEWLIQPFFPPKRVHLGIARTGFLIWRIYAIRQACSEPFQLLGGLWSLRPHLKVHGASNTVTGPVVR